MEQQQRRNAVEVVGASSRYKPNTKPEAEMNSWSWSDEPKCSRPSLSSVGKQPATNKPGWRL